MGIKKYRPLTPGLRFKTGLTFEEITKKTPEKALTSGKPKNAGRGAGGRISVLCKGGGHKRRYRIVDFRWGQDRDSRERSPLSSTTPTAAPSSPSSFTRTGRTSTHSRRSLQ